MTQGILSRLGATILLAVFVAACAPPPVAPPPPTIVAIAVQATAGVNPSVTGSAAPVVVRIYQLASDAAFNNADYLQLYNQEGAVLGPDLVASDEIIVAPGETQNMTKQFLPNGRFLGVAAFYRDIDRSAWRAIAPIPANATTTAVITLQELTVGLATETAVPPPADGN